MTDIQPQSSGSNEPPGGEPQFVKDDNVVLVYVLYAASMIVGLTVIVGLIMAYMKRGEADEIAASHYTFLIRTFWFGLLGAFIGSVTIFAGIGVVIMAAVAVWVIIRIAMGFLRYNDGKPIADPQTFTW